MNEQWYNSINQEKKHNFSMYVREKWKWTLMLCTPCKRAKDSEKLQLMDTKLSSGGDTFCVRRRFIHLHMHNLDNVNT